MTDKANQKPSSRGSEQNHTVFFPFLDRFNAFSDGVFAIATHCWYSNCPFRRGTSLCCRR